MFSQSEDDVEDSDAPQETTTVSPRTLAGLNRAGDVVHVAVAALLIVMTALVLAYATLVYARQAPLLFATLRRRSAAPAPGTHAPDPFISSSIEFLSNLLFAVILLEILHTTLTFLRHRSSRAVLRAFMVVAILSIVRKILLVEAQASLTGEEGLPFVQSAGGILVCILGILSLVAGLIYTRSAPAAPGASPGAPENQKSRPMRIRG